MAIISRKCSIEAIRKESFSDSYSQVINYRVLVAKITGSGRRMLESHFDRKSKNRSLCLVWGPAHKLNDMLTPANGQTRILARLIFSILSSVETPNFPSSLLKPGLTWVVKVPLNKKPPSYFQSHKLKYTYIRLYKTNFPNIPEDWKSRSTWWPEFSGNICNGS